MFLLTNSFFGFNRPDYKRPAYASRLDTPSLSLPLLDNIAPAAVIRALIHSPAALSFAWPSSPNILHGAKPAEIFVPPALGYTASAQIRISPPSLPRQE